MSLTVLLDLVQPALDLVLDLVGLLLGLAGHPFGLALCLEVLVTREQARGFLGVALGLI